MPIERKIKIESVMQMLQSFFRANDVVMAEVLERRVEKDIISVALNEHLIKCVTVNGERKYRILSKGKDYMYN